jgi:hypothetical protein
MTVLNESLMIDSIWRVFVSTIKTQVNKKKESCGELSGLTYCELTPTDILEVKRLAIPSLHLKMRRESAYFSLDWEIGKNGDGKTEMLKNERIDVILGNENKFILRWNNNEFADLNEASKYLFNTFFEYPPQRLNS